MEQIADARCLNYRRDALNSRCHLAVVCHKHVLLARVAAQRVTSAESWSERLQACRRRHCRIVVPSDASALPHSPNMRRSIPATRKQNSLLRQASVGSNSMCQCWSSAVVQGGLKWFVAPQQFFSTSTAATELHMQPKEPVKHIFFFFCVWERDSFRRA